MQTIIVINIQVFLLFPYVGYYRLIFLSFKINIDIFRIPKLKVQNK